MEQVATQAPAPEVQAPEVEAPAAAPVEYASGGMTEDPKVKYISLALMGIAAASVIYSIYWYRKQLMQMEKKNDGGSAMQQQVEEIKLNLMSLMGDNYQRM